MIDLSLSIYISCFKERVATDNLDVMFSPTHVYTENVQHAMGYSRTFTV